MFRVQIDEFQDSSFDRPLFFQIFEDLDVRWLIGVLNGFEELSVCAICGCTKQEHNMLMCSEYQPLTYEAYIKVSSDLIAAERRAKLADETARAVAETLQEVVKERDRLAKKLEKGKKK